MHRWGSRRDSIRANTYANLIIDQLRGTKHKCMQDYRKLLQRNKEARSAVYKFSTQKKIPIICNYDGNTNCSTLLPIIEERNDEVLHEILSLESISEEESESTPREFLTVTPLEGSREVSDNKYVSSEQEESYEDGCDLHYGAPLEVKQKYTDLKRLLRFSDYVRDESESVYEECPDHELRSSRQYGSSKYRSGSKYQYQYKEPKTIFTPKKFRKIPNCIYSRQTYDMTHRNVRTNNTTQLRYIPHSEQYYVQRPYSRYVNHDEIYYNPGYTNYYEKPVYYYNYSSYEPYYTTDPNEAYFDYLDYLQFQRNGYFFDPYGICKYVTPLEQSYYHRQKYLKVKPFYKNFHF